MKFISMTETSEKKLNNKVNDFLNSNPDINIIKFEYEVFYRKFSIAIIYS
ncbi:hypothetical protein [Staphylococcus warneri]|nr:hypothetical protein [Staphylococcus warneri]MCG1126289.1 hypothetical protein [Staphylococcus epidermidis]MCJ1788146.1 hypothetical protein [Staphylococcus warneri]MCJ1790552.1 hypothetical protein [Staphylococcus warneri]MCJ1793025.1 hypothetical protein [Staphylococcus warneri]MCJ1795482.1 hypothetical protein [Staphylococcus warneri]